jgi:hypothetical protein
MTSSRLVHGPASGHHASPCRLTSSASTVRVAPQTADCIAAPYGGACLDARRSSSPPEHQSPRAIPCTTYTEPRVQRPTRQARAGAQQSSTGLQPAQENPWADNTSYRRPWLAPPLAAQLRPHTMTPVAVPVPCTLITRLREIRTAVSALPGSTRPRLTHYSLVRKLVSDAATRLGGNMASATLPPSPDSPSKRINCLMHAPHLVVKFAAWGSP